METQELKRKYANRKYANKCRMNRYKGIKKKKKNYVKDFMWITTNGGKFFKRWKYQTTLLYS